MLSSTFMMLLGSSFLMLRLGGVSGSFPSPLSAAEERECVERSLAGDLEARNKLIEHNLRLVAHIVKKYYTRVGDQDDLISIGTIGLIKGVSTYRPDKGVRLATYASRCVENAILSQRNNRRLRWRNGCLLRQNGACWREWESAAIF
ncbi:MAG: sigma-70 family RNA polymerase sigma factor [Candidatus Heteroscillospira sp.]|jgi:RNA polymerase sporulation-specific sigma factor